MAANQKAEMHLEEVEDGSVVVELPDNIEPVDEDDKEPVNEQKNDQDDEQDHPDDSEAVRAARRARRRAKKDLIRKTNEEKDIRLMQLQRENEEVKRRLMEVERRTAQSDLAQVNKIIEDHQVRLEYAKMKLAEAASSNDGQALVEAQQLWRNAERDLEKAENYRQQMERKTNNTKQADMPDPILQRNAATWMERNSWYKVDGSDTDSKIAKQVDEELSSEGWDPKTADYWDELDNRLQKYLPHRYNTSSDENQSVRKPRNVVGSSGREASSAFGGSNRNTFVLSPERVRAMKESGAWDNKERREKMMKYFMEFDKANRNK